MHYKNLIFLLDRQMVILANKETINQISRFIIGPHLALSLALCHVFICPFQFRAKIFKSRAP